MACSMIPMMPDQMFRRAGSAAPAQPRQRTMTSVPVAAAQAPAPEELRLSDLDWIADLGEAGLATVYKARHRRTGAVFALKMTFDPDLLAAEAEAKVLARAAGAPHVVDFHALLRGPGGMATFVLEYMDAGSLGGLLLRRGGMGTPEAALAEVAAQCVVALAQLHSRGVAHLDVKPDNLLASTRGEIKISDFNLSRILYGGSGERLLVPITRGTKVYFGPERFAAGAHAGPHGAMAADVWGLGITVLEMFLGRRPILPGVEKAYTEEIKQAVCDGEPPSVTEDAEASAELRAFVAACVQKEPTRRATALREIILETL